jgi:hypothetical protein
MEGKDGHVAEALPLDKVRELLDAREKPRAPERRGGIG